MQLIALQHDNQALLKAKCHPWVAAALCTPEKHQKVMWPWPMTLKFNRVIEVVEVHVRAKFHQAKCNGSRVINNALDFGQL